MVSFKNIKQIKCNKSLVTETYEPIFVFPLGNLTDAVTPPSPGNPSPAATAYPDGTPAATLYQPPLHKYVEGEGRGGKPDSVVFQRKENQMDKDGKQGMRRGMITGNLTDAVTPPSPGNPSPPAMAYPDETPDGTPAATLYQAATSQGLLQQPRQGHCESTKPWGRQPGDGVWLTGFAKSVIYRNLSTEWKIEVMHKNLEDGNRAGGNSFLWVLCLEFISFLDTRNVNCICLLLVKDFK
ncbi:hypothetical protein LXL04_011526 [Taraxacum kok-saghyz]